uniref:Putative secreted protein n=1 Tax=Anopheles marajoara TaxID=58244 RepID=A0A2M4C6R7_9DIPT
MSTFIILLFSGTSTTLCCGPEAHLIIPFRCYFSCSTPSSTYTLEPEYSGCKVHRRGSLVRHDWDMGVWITLLGFQGLPRAHLPNIYPTPVYVPTFVRGCTVMLLKCVGDCEIELRTELADFSGREEKKRLQPTTSYATLRSML